MRERKKDSETDTYRQARPQGWKAGKESEKDTGRANNYPIDFAAKQVRGLVHG